MNCGTWVVSAALAASVSFSPIAFADDPVPLTEDIVAASAAKDCGCVRRQRKRPLTSPSSYSVVPAVSCLKINQERVDVECFGTGKAVA
jgi:hypothetical protein